jgi:hypothetical protein
VDAVPDRRALRLLLVSALVALVGLSLPAFSTAAFTSTSANTTSRVTAAPDWTPPTVTMTGPGASVKDTVNLAATASDGETGISAVVMEYQPTNGTAWVTVCTTSTAPYTCAWNTGLVADGSYDVRARATDNAGYSTTSDPVRTTVANNLLVVLTSPGDVVRGTVPVTTTVYNAGSLSSSVRVEYAPAGTTTWKTLCTAAASPWTCSWATTGYANGDYDLRAVAVSGSTSYTSASVTDVTVDNAAPTVTMVDPGSPLSGTRTFTATASDAHSGVASVVVQYAATGTSTWKTLCTVTTSPYSCRVDTTSIPDGSYAFRAVATDVAGNTATSGTVSSRLVDNTVSAVSVEDPGAFLSGTVALTASASSTAGVTSVRLQYAPGGTSTWTDVCTDTTSPYACSWDTTKVTDGLYDLRAVLLDGSGRTTTSAVDAGHRVDNTPLRGADVQAANGGSTVGRIEAGDSITFTYTDQVNPATVTAGWTGADRAVSVRVRDGNVLGLGHKGDTLDVLVGGTAVNLGSVSLKEDHVKSGRTLTFTGTMTAGTTTVGGAVRTTVTVRLGSLASGGGPRTATLPAAMVWTPSAGVTDLSGNAGSAAPTAETGILDRDF